MSVQTNRSNMIKPQKIILNNGMTLLLIENHASPVVAFNACFRVGSIVETDEEAGICHLIEHMIFKGTPTRKAGEIAASIESAGGDINAYTSFDETVYYCTVSSRYFDEGLDILSDAVLNPLFETSELEREKPVVIEEINRSHDSPSKVLSENLFKTVFQKHPYGRPIIGSKETVMSFTHEKIMEFYRRWYVPENLVFVVSGDFQTDEARSKVEKIFSSFSAKAAPSLNIVQEKPQNTARSVFLTKNFEGYYVQLAFPIPNLEHPDLPALDILSHVLGEGLSSRLEQRIKEKKSLVDSIYTYAYTPKYPGVFVVGFTTQEKKVIPAAQAILKEIFSLDHEPITHAELVLARTNIKSDAWYERETVEGLARKYGYFETTLGNYNFDKKYYQKIEEVEVEDLQEVVQRYFRKETLNVAALFPEGHKIDLEKLKPNYLCQNLTNNLKVVKKASDEIQVKKLKNGIRLVFKKNSNLPLLSVRLVNYGGLRSENPKSNGLHHLLAQVLTKGTQNRSAEELALEIEGIAAGIDAFSGRNVDGLQGDFLSEKWREGLDLFTDILLHPAFDKNEIEKERKNTLQAIHREQDQLASIAYKKFFRELYPKHPYGMPVIGTKQSVQGIRLADLRAAHETLLNPKNMVVSVVGDFDPDSIEDFLNDKLSPLKSKKSTALKLSMPEAPGEIIRIEDRKSNKMQTHIVLGFLGTKINSQDRYSLDVLNNILAGQGGRLFIELRDKLSLAYSVTSFSQEGLERGFFSVYIATEPQKVNKAIEGILRELSKIKTELVSENEIERAKKYIVGSYEIDLQRNATVANQLAFNELYGLGAREIRKLPEKILKINREDVLKTANKYFNLDAYVLSIVGG